MSAEDKKDILGVVKILSGIAALVIVNTIIHFNILDIGYLFVVAILFLNYLYHKLKKDDV